MIEFESQLLKRILNKEYKGEILKFYNKDYSIFHKIVHKTLGPITIDLDKCVKCGICERNCPYNAIKLRRSKNGVIIDDI